jgi:hypothetical protein
MHPRAKNVKALPVFVTEISRAISSAQFFSSAKFFSAQFFCATE